MISKLVRGDGYIPQEQRVDNLDADQLGHLMSVNMLVLANLAEAAEQYGADEIGWLRDIITAFIAAGERRGRLSVGMPTRDDIEFLEQVEEDMEQS